MTIAVDMGHKATKTNKQTVSDYLDFHPDLFIVTNLCNIACLERISSRKVITSLQTFSNTSDKKRLINDLS